MADDYPSLDLDAILDVPIVYASGCAHLVTMLT